MSIDTFSNFTLSFCLVAAAAATTMAVAAVTADCHGTHGAAADGGKKLKKSEEAKDIAAAWSTLGDTYNRLNDLGSEVWFIYVGSEVFIECSDSFGVNKGRVGVC